MNYLYTLAGIVLLWSLVGYFSSRVEKAEYSVLESRAGYEVRLYPAHIVAQTTVKGSYKEALNGGFRIIAGYIFGGNTKKESIAMTAPVMATVEDDSHTIAFGMPRSYTLDTLPKPNDSRVEIVTIPEKKMAVMRFSWFRTDARVQSKKGELLDVLKKDSVSIIGEPQYAGYNAPWTPPWMTRNEVIVEIK
jgi:effector-binding domain-containing protein